jgi:hypothetical protein
MRKIFGKEPFDVFYGVSPAATFFITAGAGINPEIYPHGLGQLCELPTPPTRQRQLDNISFGSSLLNVKSLTKCPLLKLKSFRKCPLLILQ